LRTNGNDAVVTQRQSKIGGAGRHAALAVALLLAAWLTGCSTADQLSQQAATPAEPAKSQPELSPAAQREHQRILAAYGGAYDDPHLEGLIGHTVDRLVAASERPDITYKVTILNSPAVNAFALPTGQLYVTRGLLALSNDTAELASVLSHEMAHVIARHAAIREDQARRVALVSRVVSDVLSDPQVGALALARSRWRASRARRNSRRTASASAFPHGRASILMARSASSPPWAATSN
jgi:predicted Zn-dependent protease